MEENKVVVETKEEEVKETIIEKVKSKKNSIIKWTLIGLGTIGAAAAAICLVTKDHDEKYDEYSQMDLRAKGLTDGTPMNLEPADDERSNLWVITGVDESAESKEETTAE